MKRAEKAERIVELLEELYPTVPVPLDHTDAFTLLVAVALSLLCGLGVPVHRLLIVFGKAISV